jgi:FKBP-type peptidyl-prolyl cis-trans isomerase 2
MKARYCIYMALVILAGGTAGCSGVGRAAKIGPGDPVTLNYTCRLHDGAVAATTLKEVAEDAAQSKADIFAPGTAGVSLVVTAGGSTDGPAESPLRSFENEITLRLAKRVIGMAPGETRRVELRGDDGEGVRDEGKPLQLAVVRKRPRELRFSRDYYLANAGREPEVGRSFVRDPLIPGKIVAVNDKEVLIRFEVKDGTVVTTPYGKGVIRERPERYEIVLEPMAGTLVRSGPLVGRIIEVSDQYFFIDYRDPFGGESLACAVTAAPAGPKPDSALEKGSE